MLKVNDQVLLSPELQRWADELREICRTDLYTFARVVLNYNLLEERIHVPICAFLTDSFLDATIFPQLKNEKKRIPIINHPHSLRRRKKLLMLPRNSLKTTLVAQALPLFILKECPNWSIMIDSETKERSNDILSHIKKQIEGNYIFRALYGDWVGHKWDATKIIISKRFRAGSTPSIITSGANVSTTGYHPDVIICDDLHSPDNTTSQELIEKVKEHWRELYRQLNPGGFMLIDGTPYTLTDLYAHIKDNFKDEYDMYQHSAYNSDGTLWYPERLSEEYLEEQKGTNQRELEMFNAHYKLDPSPIGDKRMDITKLKYYRSLDFNKVNLFLLVDPGYSTGKYASRFAIALTGMDCDKNSYLVDYFVGRLPPHEGVQKVVEIALKWHPAKFPLKIIGVEAESGGIAFASHCREKLIDANIICTFMPLKSKGMSKESRILKKEGLEICVNEGHFYIQEWMKDFIAEANYFPKGTSMDLLDAVAYHFFIAFPPPKPEAPVVHDDWYRIQRFAERQMNPQDRKTYHPVFGRITLK